MVTKKARKPFPWENKTKHKNTKTHTFDGCSKQQGGRHHIPEADAPCAEQPYAEEARDKSYVTGVLMLLQAGSRREREQSNDTKPGKIKNDAGK